MSSPAKRRKTNKHDVAISRGSRGLDYFFGKQQTRATNGAAPVADPASSSAGVGTEAQENAGMTDEDLARQLQEEWNNEHVGCVASVLTAAAITNPVVVGQPREDGEQSGSDTREVLEEMNEATQDEPEAIGLVGPSSTPGTQGDHSTILDSTGSMTESKKHTLTLQSATAAEDNISTTIPFDQSPLTFDPAQYLPDLKKQWATEGDGATYALLTRCFVLINSTQSRIKIVDTLVNLLRILIEGDADSLLPAVWLATNSISPPYIDLELGLGGSAISKALKKVCGLDNAALKSLYNKYGDAGDVAFEAKKRQSLTLRKPKPLIIKDVFESLVKIANSKGTGSVEVKQRIVERLVQDARGAEESRYIVRTLVQHLRIGAVKTTMLIALSRAILLSKPPGATFETRDTKQLATLKKENLAEVWSKSEEIVKACFARRPNYNDLVPTLLEIGVCDELLVRCGLALHIPLRPMLGSITRDLGDMLTKLNGREFSCEYKYDGQRAQVHCDERGKVTIFSRHLEVMTDKYPDLVSLVPKIRGEGVSSFIMEGEVVAIDRESGDLRTFQTLANRARKDVVIGSVTIDVCLFAFDLMYLNGEELLNRPFRERRELLRSLFTEIPHHFTWVKSLDATSGDSDIVLEFFKSATDIKCEGIMVKILDNLPTPAVPNQLLHEFSDVPPSVEVPARPVVKAKKASKSKASKQANADDPPLEKSTRRKALLSTYEPDKRVDSWLKVKKDYNTAADTLDLVPVAAWHGSGRKCNWWSPILLAVRNPETGTLEAVTKCMSGFTDKFYQANKEKYAEGSDNVIARPSYVEYAGTPDVWFRADEVWELAFADISLSPTYTAARGLVSEERGLSTRFPRFLKVREDKSVDEASTPEFLAELYRKQEARAPGETGAVVAGDDKAMNEEDEWY